MTIAATAYFTAPAAVTEGYVLSADAWAGGGEAMLAAGSTEGEVAGMVAAGEANTAAIAAADAAAVTAAQTATAGACCEAAGAASVSGAGAGVASLAGSAAGTAAEGAAAAMAGEGTAATGAGAFIGGSMGEAAGGALLLCNPITLAVGATLLVGACKVNTVMHSHEGGHVRFQATVCQYCGKLFPGTAATSDVKSHEQECKQRTHMTLAEAKTHCRKGASDTVVSSFEKHFGVGGEHKEHCVNQLGHAQGRHGTFLGHCTYWDGEKLFGVIRAGSEQGDEADVAVEAKELKNGSELRVGDVVSLQVVNNYSIDPSKFSEHSTCEWMFADAATGFWGINALAHLNPLRWSGSISFEKAIADLLEAQQTGDRPILVKVPANCMQSKEYKNIQEAIAYLAEYAGISMVKYAKAVERHPFLTAEDRESVEGYNFDCWQQIVGEAPQSGWFEAPPSLDKLVQHEEVTHHSVHDYCVMVKNKKEERFRIAPVILPTRHVALHADRLFV